MSAISKTQQLLETGTKNDFQEKRVLPVVRSTEHGSQHVLEVL